jgi:predicted dehydrogenase
METSKNFGFGIIGMGMIAEFHAKAIKDLSGCRFVGGYSAFPGRAAEFCAKNGGKGYDNMDAFMADKDIDIVTIASASGRHLDDAVAAAKAGKHIIVEKPLEISAARCDALIAAAKANNIKIMSIVQSRTHAPSALIKKAIDEGRLGKIVLADAQIKWWRTQEYYDNRKKRGTLQQDGGGALMNQGIHCIDLLQGFMGTVTEVFSYTTTLAHQNIDVEDTAVAVLKFANGALGVIQGTTGAYPGFLKKIEICGSKGSVVMEEENILTWQFADERPEDEEIRKKFGAATQTGGGASDPKAISHLGHKMLFESFVNSLRDGTPVALDGVEGKKSVEIIEATYRSAKSGSPVALPLTG